MNGKYYGETGGAFSSDDGMRAEILNPFVHKLELDNTFDKIKVGKRGRRCIPRCITELEKVNKLPRLAKYVWST